MTRLKVSRKSGSNHSNAQQKMQKDIIEYLKAHGVTNIDIGTVNTSNVHKPSTNRHGLVVKG